MNHRSSTDFHVLFSFAALHERCGTVIFSKRRVVLYLIQCMTVLPKPENNNNNYSYTYAGFALHFSLLLFFFFFVNVRALFSSCVCAFFPLMVFLLIILNKV